AHGDDSQRSGNRHQQRPGTRRFRHRLVVNRRLNAKLVDNLLVDHSVQWPQPLQDLRAIPGFLQAYVGRLVPWVPGQPGLEVSTVLPRWISLKTDQPIGGIGFDIVRGHSSGHSKSRVAALEKKDVRGIKFRYHIDSKSLRG